MKNKKLVILVVVLCCIPFFAFKYFSDKAEAKEEVKSLIEKAYIHGAFNELNPEAMANGFHPDFSIYSAKGEEIDKYPIKNWVESVRKRKADPDFDPSKNKWEHKFANVDVTGASAAAKIELYKDGKKVYTDYLSLLKFPSGWKIVAKVYHKH
ncbi:nuclear transport factor 2 family protein [Fulvivirgaceae bacterium BMA10]|uniref:Nuclear transport factor 2 family protein n=1 Tax=Splendidivirga corallicola TaxID=3051826 RepID=A0ABT8KRG4_9BACT|nr:nuclear transport factor 2 family protein [Fulvivirgaceae bacterium BMA10]